MLKLFKARKIYTPVYIDGTEADSEEYQVIDINPNIAVIRDPEKLEPEDYYRAATTHPEQYYAAKIEYNVDDNLIYSSIEKLSVYDPFQRGKHMGRTLLIHVLSKLKENQKIWTSASADPMPVDMDDPDGPCYGLKQDELEKYYKRFSYGKKQRQILFKREMEEICRQKNKNR